MSKGTQGKWAEGEVQKYLERLGNRHATFDWDRIPDARATRGKLSKEADADFQAFLLGSYAISTSTEVPARKEERSDGTLKMFPIGSPVVTYAHLDYREKGPLQIPRNFLLEVKEVIDIPNRLPYKNFDTGAVGRMLKRQLAGCEGWILVCHRPQNVWRAVPLEPFRTRNEKTPSGSWNLAAYPVMTLPEAMTTIFGIQP